MRVAKVVVTWALQILFGLLFVMLGVMKFRPSWVGMFARWGYPDGFHMVIGVLEAAGGLALIVPRFTTYGAALLATIMVGAALTHLVHQEMQRIGVPIAYLLVVTLVGWLRRASALPLRARPARREAVI